MSLLPLIWAGPPYWLNNSECFLCRPLHLLQGQVVGFLSLLTLHIYPHLLEKTIHYSVVIVACQKHILRLRPGVETVISKYSPAISLLCRLIHPKIFFD